MHTDTEDWGWALAWIETMWRGGRRAAGVISLAVGGGSYYLIAGTLIAAPLV